MWAAGGCANARKRVMEGRAVICNAPLQPLSPRRGRAVTEGRRPPSGFSGALLMPLLLAVVVNHAVDVVHHLALAHAVQVQPLRLQAGA